MARRDRQDRSYGPRAPTLPEYNPVGWRARAPTHVAAPWAAARQARAALAGAARGRLRATAPGRTTAWPGPGRAEHHQRDRAPRVPSPAVRQAVDERGGAGEPPTRSGQDPPGGDGSCEHGRRRRAVRPAA